MQCLLRKQGKRALSLAEFKTVPASISSIAVKSFVEREWTSETQCLKSHQISSMSWALRTDSSLSPVSGAPWKEATAWTPEEYAPEGVLSVAVFRSILGSLEFRVFRHDSCKGKSPEHRCKEKATPGHYWGWSTDVLFWCKAGYWNHAINIFLYFPCSRHSNTVSMTGLERLNGK